MTRSNRSASAGAAVRPLLALKAAQWPTPQTSDSGGIVDEKAADLSHIAENSEREQLCRRVAVLLRDLGLLDPTTSAHGRSSFGPTQSSFRGRLNPAFEEWLMGFPIGWTEVPGTTGSEPSATPSSRPNPNSPSESSGSG
jgi:hypothetical protein